MPDDVLCGTWSTGSLSPEAADFVFEKEGIPDDVVCLGIGNHSKAGGFQVSVCVVGGEACENDKWYKKRGPQPRPWPLNCAGPPARLPKPTPNWQGSTDDLSLYL